MKATTTKAKLELLLPHWIEHNRSHGNEFSQWAETARRDGLNDLAALLDEAAGSLNQAEALLRDAARAAGIETGAAHHHHGPHSHIHNH